MKTVRLLGVPIQYDPTVVYGVFDDKGAYKASHPKAILKRFKNPGNLSFLAYCLDSQLEQLSERWDANVMLEELVSEGILTTKVEPSQFRQRRTAVRETIELLTYALFAVKGRIMQQCQPAQYAFSEFL